jgi:response regulator RpfG family c-di-GMP phosphodiesterase
MPRRRAPRTLEGMARPHAAVHPRILDRLLAERKITRDQGEAVLALWRRDGGWVEEILLESGVFTEADLLRALAAVYKTRFVSTDKLSKAVIDKHTLDLVPRKVAERNHVVPVLLDRRTATLSIVTPDPENVQVLEEVKMASRVREVQALIARPDAIVAAISKFYDGNERPFMALARQAAEAMQPTVDTFGRTIGATPNTGQMRGVDPLTLDLERFGDSKSPSAHAPAPPEHTTSNKLSLPPPQPTTGTHQVRPALALEIPAPAPAPVMPLPLPTPPPPPQQQPVAQPTPPPVAVPSPPPPADESWLETLNVLVSLLENNRPDLRGHSAHVARLTRKLAERVGLSEREVDQAVAAAFLHDLGKASSYHLTALNVAEYEGHRVAAKKSYLTPTRLMDSVKLSEPTVKALSHMYERFDGKGFPDGLAGKDIPIGARFLAITDTYADLTQNPRNPFRKTLRPVEASDVLHKFRGQIFDPNLVDIFRHVVTGDDLKAKLLANRRTALLVDPDPEETTVLELRMIEAGFEVKIVRSADAALKILGEQDFEMVVSEAELQPFDGFELLDRARKTDGGKDAVWVFLASRADRDSINRGFELGATDYVQKPSKAEILVAKLRKLVEQGAPAKQVASRGVSGSLEEMGLPDMVQILAQGRKTGALKITAGNDRGEIHFVNGEIYNASFGKLKAEDAMYAMIRLRSGDFALDPNFKAEARVITMSAEGLLLEGMRRLDESSRVGSIP